MWIRTKEKLVNTRHLAEIVLKSYKGTNGMVHEVVAVPARKENQVTTLYCDADRVVSLSLLTAIGLAMGTDKKEFIIP